MTTLAWDGRHLAADGRLTSGDLILTDDDCKISITNNMVIAFCGSTSDYKMLSDAIANNENKSGKDLGSSALFLESADSCALFSCSTTSNGEFWKCSCEGFNRAIGSGGAFAITAMDTGLNAMEAVKMAIMRDIYSGGTIRYFDTENPNLGIQVYE